MSFVSCLADPINAAPAKYPDEFQGRTVALKLRQSVALPVNDDGTGALRVCGSLGGFARTWPVALLSDATNPGKITTEANGLNHEEMVTLDANMKGYRPVSLGVRVVYTGSNDTSKGEIIVYGSEGQQFVFNSDTTSDYSRDPREWRDYQGAVSVDVRTLGKGIFSAFHAFDRMPFFDITTDFSSFQKLFPVCNIAVVGAIAGDAGFRIETYLNIEAIPKPKSVHHDLAKTAALDPRAQANARRLASTRVGMRPPLMIAGASGHGRGIRKGLGTTMTGTRKRSVKRKKRTVRKGGRKYAKSYGRR